MQFIWYPLYISMEEEEGFSPAVPIWGVLRSLICSIPAALSEGLPGTDHPCWRSWKCHGGFLVSQRKMRWNERQVQQGQGTAQEGASVKSEGFIRGWGESLECQQDTADSPVLLKLKMSDRFGKFAWQKTGIWGVKNKNMHIDKHI